MAYPIYLTIGNILKEIHHKPSRRAQILMGYIPTTKFEGIAIKASCHHTQMNLFHLCMGDLLAPINSIGETGIEMMSGDRIWRQCHPIFAVFIGDYLEQVLITCTYSCHCPKCTTPHDQLGEYTQFPF
jgi:Plavaka transposase